MKALVVDDDVGIIEAVRLTFHTRWQNMLVYSARMGRHGVALVKSKDPDIVVLDLGLPDINGFTVLKKIRSFSQTPVVILTAHNEESSIIKALEWGADDYIVKPFRAMELLSRINTVMRRQTPPPTPIGVGSLHLDPINRFLFYRRKKILLTPTEVDILFYLIKNHGRSVDHVALAQKVWGNDLPSSLQSLEFYIKHLQTKIEEDPPRPHTITREIDGGYCLKVQDELRVLPTVH